MILPGAPMSCQAVTVLGKESEENRAVLEAAIKSGPLAESIKHGRTVIVGSLLFYQLLENEGVPCLYLRRPYVTGLATDAEIEHCIRKLAERLGALIASGGIVYMLPDAGRMTTIERLFAEEVGARLVYLEKEVRNAEK